MDFAHNEIGPIDFDLTSGQAFGAAGESGERIMQPTVRTKSVSEGLRPVRRLFEGGLRDRIYNVTYFTKNPKRAYEQRRAQRRAAGTAFGQGRGWRILGGALLGFGTGYGAAWAYHRFGIWAGLGVAGAGAVASLAATNDMTEEQADQFTSWSSIAGGLGGAVYAYYNVDVWGAIKEQINEHVIEPAGRFAATLGRDIAYPGIHAMTNRLPYEMTEVEPSSLGAWDIVESLLSR